MTYCFALVFVLGFGVYSAHDVIFYWDAQFSQFFWASKHRQLFKAAFNSKSNQFGKYNFTVNSREPPKIANFYDTCPVQGRLPVCPSWTCPLDPVSECIHHTKIRFRAEWFSKFKKTRQIVVVYILNCCLYRFDEFFNTLISGKIVKKWNERSVTIVMTSGWTRKLCTWNKNQNAKAKGYNRKTQNCVEPSFPPSRHAPIKCHLGLDHRPPIWPNPPSEHWTLLKNGQNWAKMYKNSVGGQ